MVVQLGGGWSVMVKIRRRMSVVVLHMFEFGNGRREEVSMFNHLNPFFLFLILVSLLFWVVFFCYIFSFSMKEN